jgi:hypothetical protein
MPGGELREGVGKRPSDRPFLVPDDQINMGKLRPFSDKCFTNKIHGYPHPAY